MSLNDIKVPGTESEAVLRIDVNPVNLGSLARGSKLHSMLSLPLERKKFRLASDCFILITYQKCLATVKMIILTMMFKKEKHILFKK